MSKTKSAVKSRVGIRKTFLYALTIILKLDVPLLQQENLKAQGPYTQHFIFFVSYEWAQLACATLHWAEKASLGQTI